MDELNHWADVAAARTLQAHPDQRPITVAAGITPSGVVHIGNFREVMTVDLVARALRDRGVEVRFLYSWDDFDAFRKVPADALEREPPSVSSAAASGDGLIRKRRHDSYACTTSPRSRPAFAPLGIRLEFICQSRAYRVPGRYAEASRNLRADPRRDHPRHPQRRARAQRRALAASTTCCRCRPLRLRPRRSRSSPTTAPGAQYAMQLLRARG
ncbi:MAG: hypothetical protein U0168_31645 [Nannocystaceae bacterium]